MSSYFMQFLYTVCINKGMLCDVPQYYSVQTYSIPFLLERRPAQLKVREHCVLLVLPSKLLIGVSVSNTTF